MSTTPDEPSLKMRAYLAEIYRLRAMSEQTSDFVSTSALANLLWVTAPAVNRMVNRLKEQGLLWHEPYQGIRLTPLGEQEALKQLRAHRIAECFLVEVMGIPWEDVYAEATQMSVALNDLLLERMAQMAGNPRYCPHGEPIPQADGQIEQIQDILLTHVSAHQKVSITRYRTRDRDRLAYLKALGLTPQAHAEVWHVAPFKGPLQLKIGQEYRIIGHSLAELIRVQVLP